MSSPSPTPPPPQRPQPTRGKILVAEDAPDLRALTARLIRSMSYDVITASDGEQALALIKSDQPDLVILDIMMPKLHGIDVLKQLQPHLRDTPLGVIMTSGKDFKPDVTQALELGAYAFLIKPFPQTLLADTIERFFAGSPPSPAALPSAIAPKPATPTGPATPIYAPTLDLSAGYWKLWGTRGSIPVTGARYSRHGGNTSCLEITRGDEIIIIDAGSGIRDLGTELLSRPQRNIKLLIGHTHWDHIQGFPFFAPAYVPGFTIDIYGAPGFGKDLASVFKGQLDRDYFPVDLDDMAATLNFHRLEKNPVIFGDVSISWEFVNHPGATVGFRIETPTAPGGGPRSLVYITDNEFLRGYMGRPHDLNRDSRIVQPMRKIIDLARDADLLIAEAQYTNDEYPAKIGWGHSSLSNACLLAKLANVKRWMITHHDPGHDDPFLLKKLYLTRQILKDINYPIQVNHALDNITESF